MEAQGPTNPENTVGSDDLGPEEAVRIRRFARFFKNYMSVSSLILASLPIPVTAWKVLPIYEAHRGILTTYTPVFCFLILGFLFFSRHYLARRFFPEYLGFAFGAASSATFRWGMRVERVWNWFFAMSPFFLIALSVLFVYLYHELLAISLSAASGLDPLLIDKFVPHVAGSEPLPMLPAGQLYLSEQYIMNNLSFAGVPFGSQLILYYLAIFCCAEAAFVLMAMKEYLQDLARLTDMQLIVGHAPASPKGTA